MIQIIGMILALVACLANVPVIAAGLRPVQNAVVVVDEFTNDEIEWGEFWIDSYEDHADAFTELFNALEYKCSKNGRSMIRRPGDSSFKFVPKGK